MNSSRITYIPRRDSAPESELDTLGRVYAFILQRHQERKRAARPGRPDDAEGSKNDRTATEIIPKRS